MAILEIIGSKKTAFVNGIIGSNSLQIGAGQATAKGYMKIAKATFLTGVLNNSAIMFKYYSYSSSDKWAGFTTGELVTAWNTSSDPNLAKVACDKWENPFWVVKLSPGVYDIYIETCDPKAASFVSYEIFKSDDTAAKFEIYNPSGWATSLPSDAQKASWSYLDSTYPLNSWYFTSNSDFNPAEHFGGTWELIKNRFLVGAGDKYSGGSTGGADSVTLTTDMIPSHGHAFYDNSHTWLWGSAQGTVYINQDALAGKTPSGSNRVYTKQNVWTGTKNTGGGKSHENRPPYFAVYMWRRTG